MWRLFCNRTPAELRAYKQSWPSHQWLSQSIITAAAAAAVAAAFSNLLAADFLPNLPNFKAAIEGYLL